MFQIKWEKRAIQEQVAIFEFWNKHNGSDTYSIKIYDELKRIETLLIENPNIGAETEFKGIRRIVILLNFSLYYFIQNDVIYILSIWDNHRNPKDLKF